MTPFPILSQVYWTAPGLWPVAALAAAGLLGAMVLLYLWELFAAPWLWRGVLPALILRVIAVLLLVASVLKPVAQRQATAEERGSVIVLVDRSRSMAVVDNARSHAQLVALADAMGRLQPNVRSDAATAMAAELERLRTAASEVRGAQEDLDYARVSGRDIQMRQARLQEVAQKYTANASGLTAKAAALPGSQDLTKQLAPLANPPDVALRDGWRTMVPKNIKDAAQAVADYQHKSDNDLYEHDSAVKKACMGIEKLSRFSLVEQALLRPDGVVAGARKKAAVIGYALADDATPLDLVRGDTVVSALNTQPVGDNSDLTAGINAAVAGRPVLAVVLFSDGRQVGGDKTIVSGLTPSGVPIFTVNAAAASAPHDLSFKSVVVKDSLIAGQDIEVQVEMHNSFFDGQSVDIHCQVGKAGEEEQEQEQIHTLALHKGKDISTHFTIRVTHPDPQHEECVWVWFPPLNDQAHGETDETQPDKPPAPLPSEQLPKPRKGSKRKEMAPAKVVQRWVKVVPQRMKVMLVAGTPTWDFQYVRAALARLPEMQVKDIVLDPVNPRIWIPPKEILSQDVIVLFDVPVAAFDEKHWEAVQQMAQVTGGSVILVAGDAHLPSEYARYASTAALLPFAATFKAPWTPWPGPSPAFHFVPAPDAETADFLKLPPEIEPKATAPAPPVAEGEAVPAPQVAPVESEPVAPRRWEQLPGCLRFLQLPEVHSKDLKPHAGVVLVEEESRLPVLTEMPLGSGRAFFMGFNDTWRWRFKVGGRDQEHFWRQLILHASEDPYFAHDGPLALDVHTVSPHPNKKIQVRARITDDLREPTSPYTLDVLRDHKKISEHPLTPTGPAGGGRFTTTLSLPAGEYEIRWSVTGEKHVVHSVTIPLHIGGTSEDELADLSGNSEMLRKLAEASGGEFLTLEQVGRLPERLAAAGDARSRFVEVRLWDSPYLFALVIGCLGLEWALRKRVGLA